MKVVFDTKRQFLPVTRELRISLDPTLAPSGATKRGFRQRFETTLRSRESRGILNLVPSSRKFVYTVILEEDPHGHWHAYAPAVPGCFGGGRSRAQALRQYRSALKLHVEELTAQGNRVPVERRSPTVRVVVAA